VFRRLRIAVKSQLPRATATIVPNGCEELDEVGVAHPKRLLIAFARRILADRCSGRLKSFSQHCHGKNIATAGLFT